MQTFQLGSIVARVKVNDHDGDTVEFAIESSKAALHVSLNDQQYQNRNICNQWIFSGTVFPRWITVFHNSQAKQ